MSKSFLDAVYRTADKLATSKHREPFFLRFRHKRLVHNLAKDISIMYAKRIGLEALILEQVLSFQALTQGVLLLFIIRTACKKSSIFLNVLYGTMLG